MAGSLSLEELRAAAASEEIDTVIAAQVDMQGRLVGKRFQVEYFLDTAWRESHSCNYLLATDIEMAAVDGYAATSWARGYGDYVMKPDLRTLRRVPWLPGTALVLCDVLEHDGVTEVAHSPRAILKKQVARLEAKRMKACMAPELEFYLFRQSFEQARSQDYRSLSPSGDFNQDYHIFQTTKDEDVMRAIRTGLQGADVPVENTKGEADLGQMELNLRYADALVMADRHVIAKHACREVAWAGGRALTFIAKWSADRAGNACHIHQSLWSLDDRPLFYDAGAEHGMASIMRHYLAGVLEHNRALTLFLAPYVNSYKRFVAQTFAPTRAVWSLDNRTAGYRVCGENSGSVRIECRIGGADLNPYLAMAALLAAGLDGIEKEEPLEAAFVGDAYSAPERRTIPANLGEAMAALDGSAMLREAFGDAVIEHYLHAATHEQAEFDRQVSDWELRRGFERA